MILNTPNISFRTRSQRQAGHGMPLPGHAYTHRQTNEKHNAPGPSIIYRMGGSI